MILFFLTLLVTTMLIAGCGMPQILSALSGKPEAQSRQTELAPGQLLTLDGLDPSTGVLVLRIPLRKDLSSPPSGLIATLNHGDQVKFVQRDADNVFVETRDGRRGWVTSYFIKELK